MPLSSNHFKISLDELLSPLQNQNADVKILTTLQKAIKFNMEVRWVESKDAIGEIVENEEKWFRSFTLENAEDLHYRKEQIEETLKVIINY